MMRGVVAAAVTTLVMLLVSGCGGDSKMPAMAQPSPDTSTPTPEIAKFPRLTRPNTPVPTSTPTPRTTVNVQIIGAADLSDESKMSLADIVERVQAGVVKIVLGVGSGSGFTVSADGLVVTNEHVVGNASTVGVQLSNGQTHEGWVLKKTRQPISRSSRYRPPSGSIRSELGIPTACG